MHGIVSKRFQGRTAKLQKNFYLRCYIKRVAASQFLKQFYRAQTIGEVASEQFFWMHSGFEVALKQPEQAHTGFEVALERQHCQFEPAVAAR